MRTLLSDSKMVTNSFHFKVGHSRHMFSGSKFSCSAELEAGTQTLGKRISSIKIQKTSMLLTNKI
jgi:hypothetical protein